MVAVSTRTDPRSFVQVALGIHVFIADRTVMRDGITLAAMGLFRKKPLRTANAPEGEIHGGHVLGRHLSVRDLTFFGIAAIIGAGSFSSMGQACFSGGPGVIVLFLMCGVACGFTALCYAEFAARVPASGSAYTYAYVSFGELFAWIIGWALLMEYSIGNIYVAFSWSGYFTNLLEGLGLHLPDWLTINYRSASKAFAEGTTGEGLNAWNTAPTLGGLRIIFDLPAVMINALITWLVYTGVKESRNASNAMVIVKLAIIALVVIVGVFHVDINNWSPFMPNGFGGVMAGVSAVFFAYIGFDAVSTLAEESKDPQRDLPRGMIWSLVICTIVYIVLALVLTGMVNWSRLGVSDPLAEVFQLRGVKWMLFVVSIAAVVAMTSVMLVFQLGQPRIWMSMSRDGLLPKRFARIHPKYRTPGFSTIVTGLVVGIPIFFTDETFILDFTSIGTLFAFVLVCGGVLLLPPRPREKGRFHLPYVNSRWVAPFLFVVVASLLVLAVPSYFPGLLVIQGHAAQNIPQLVFWPLAGVLVAMAHLRQWSLIPLLGLLSCCYLLTGMAVSNWAWFAVWLLIGLCCYFAYGYRHSKLAPSRP
jgi:amino acid transporter